MILPTIALLAQGFYLHDGDRVLFYGDSITEQLMYTVYVEGFVRTRFPGLKVSFVNRGWSGDTTWGQTEGGPAKTRVERDVDPEHATVFTILFGMNDGGYVPYAKQTDDRFRDSYEKLISMIQAGAPGARGTLIESSPWDDFTRGKSGGYNDALIEYGKIVSSLAQEHGFLFVDFNKPMREVMISATKDDPKVSKDIVPDWIHPGPAGHMIMASELLKAWGAPATVSELEIDGDQVRVANNVHVKNVREIGIKDTDALQWTSIEGALPFYTTPQGPAVDMVLKHYPMESELNQELLRVHNLPGKHYQLSIDGQKIAPFATEELEAGVNLALYDTPMRKQSAKVVELAWKRSQLAHDEWKGVIVRYCDRKRGREAIAALDRLVNELDNEEIRAAQPVPHHFELSHID